jgi:hypothetical protein
LLGSQSIACPLLPLLVTLSATAGAVGLLALACRLGVTPIVTLNWCVP